MPIYEYKCEKCEAHVEKMQKLADAPLTVCEFCGGKLEKQWSLSGIQFKGAGWYVNDYSNKLKDPNAASSEKSGKTETTDKSEKSEKSDQPEKTSAAESTAKSESASNQSNDAAAASTTVKKDAAAKKD